MYVGGTVVWMDEDNPAYYVMWNNSATFTVYLNGEEVEPFTAYCIDDHWEAIEIAREYMEEKTD
jgi:hypothetical protein